VINSEREIHNDMTKGSENIEIFIIQCIDNSKTLHVVWLSTCLQNAQVQKLSMFFNWLLLDYLYNNHSKLSNKPRQLLVSRIVCES